MLENVGGLKVIVITVIIYIIVKTNRVNDIFTHFSLSTGSIPGMNCTNIQ